MSKAKHIFRLALPLIVAQLAQASMGFIDTVLMGMLGVEALAGGGLGAAVFNLFFIVCSGVLVATSTIVAFAVGNNDSREVHKTLLSSMVIAVALSCVFGFMLWHMGAVLSLLGQSESSILMTETYLRSVAFAMLPALAFMALRNFSMGLGLTGSILKITLLGALCNFPVSYALMTGFWVLPEMGLQGIGYGTVLVSSLMFFAFVWDLYRFPTIKKYPFWQGWGQYKLRSVITVLTLGVPIAIAFAMEAGLFAAAALLAGMLGEIELASHQIALQCITLSFMIPVGLSQAVSILVGQSYGGDKLNDAEAYAKTGVLIGLGGSLTAALAFWFIPEVIVALFTQGAETLDIRQVQQTGVTLLWVAALFQLVDGVQVITMGALRGLKLASSPTMITVVGYWGVGFPCAYWLMSIWGIQGVWAGLGIGLAVTAVMLVALFFVYLHRLKHPLSTGAAVTVFK